VDHYLPLLSRFVPAWPPGGACGLRVLGRPPLPTTAADSPRWPVCKRRLGKQGMAPGWH